MKGEPRTLYACQCGHTLTSRRDNILDCCRTREGVIHRLNWQANAALNWDPELNPPYTDWGLVMEEAAELLHATPPPCVTGCDLAGPLTRMLVAWFRQAEAMDADFLEARYADLMSLGIDPRTAPDPRRGG